MFAEFCSIVHQQTMTSCGLQARQPEWTAPLDPPQAHSKRSSNNANITTSPLENIASILEDFKARVEEGLEAGRKEIAELKNAVVELKITVGK